MDVSGQLHARGSFIHGNQWIGAGLDAMDERKVFFPPGIKHPIIQSIACHCID
jgi:hypothetical protein